MVWIDSYQKAAIEGSGYNFVNAYTVIKTHLEELFIKYLSELLTFDETQALIENMRDQHPVLIDELMRSVGITYVNKVFKVLLRSKIPINDKVTIFETIANASKSTKMDDVIEYVRSELSRTISQIYMDKDGILNLVTFKDSTEQQLLNALKEETDTRYLSMQSGQIDKLVTSINELEKEVQKKGKDQMVLIVDPILRRPLADLLERYSQHTITLSYAEIDSTTSINVLGVIDVLFPSV